MQIAAVMTDVTTIVADIATIGTQVSFVISDVACLMAGGSVIAIPQISVQRALVLVDVLFVVVNVTPVLSAVDSVVSQIASVLADIALTERKCGSQDSKHQQTNDSSSHIASLVSGPSGLCDLEHTALGKVPERCKHRKKRGEKQKKNGKRLYHRGHPFGSFAQFSRSGQAGAQRSDVNAQQSNGPRCDRRRDC